MQYLNRRPTANLLAVSF